MSDLLSLLSLGSAGIAAQNSGVGVASNNVANANTKGYSRQRVDLNALPGAPQLGGVRAGAVDRFQDGLLANRSRNAAGSLSMSKAFSEALTDLEFRIAGSGPTMDGQLASMFSRFATAAAAPTDTVARQAAVSATRDLVEGIRRRSDAFDAARADANARIRENAVAATELSSRLAQANVAIARTNDPAMRDERDRIATQLGELVGGAARIDRDGQMRFVLDGGAVLVDGQRAAKLLGSPDPTTGDVRLEVVDGASRRDVTAELAGGRIGADLSVRDTTIAGGQASLDQFAFDLVQSANGVHAANAGLDGVGGRNLFTPPGQVAGAAKALAIDPGIEADPGTLALGAIGQGPGSNAGALAMFALADQPVATGGVRLGDAALGVVADIAHATANANAATMRDELVSGHLAGMRDSLAGVDLQEELTNLARFEHASSAMVRFVSTIDQMLGDLINRL